MYEHGQSPSVTLELHYLCFFSLPTFPRTIARSKHQKEGSLEWDQSAVILKHMTFLRDSGNKLQLVVVALHGR